MDQAVQNLVEGRYMQRMSDGPDAHNHVYGLIDEELRGRPTFAMGEETAGHDQQGARRRAQDEERIAEAEADVRAMLQEVEIDPATVDAGQIRRAAEMMLTTGQTADQVWEAAVMADAVEEGLFTEQQIGEIYGQEGLDEVLSAAAPPSRDDGAEAIAEEGDGLRSGGEVGEAQPDPAVDDGEGREPPVQEPADAAAQEPAESLTPGQIKDRFRPAMLKGGEAMVEFAANHGLSDEDVRTLIYDNYAHPNTARPKYQQYLDAKVPAEKGADGKPQLVLPGAEKIGQGEQAGRGAAAPLKPKADQKPMDIGLFGEEAQQTDLLDLAAKPPKNIPENITPPATPEDSGEKLPAGFKTAETRHTKTGAKLFVATLEERVERDEYTRLNGVAKKHGGYYSSFRGKGAIPGFQFKSDEARQKFLAETSPAKAPEAGPSDSGVKITERTRQVKGGGTETAFARYVDGKPDGVFKTREEAEAGKAAEPGFTPSQMRRLLDDEQEQLIGMWHQAKATMPADASDFHKRVIEGYKRELDRAGIWQARTEDEARDILFEKRGERVKATKPETIDIVPKSGTAPTEQPKAPEAGPSDSEPTAPKATPAPKGFRSSSEDGPLHYVDLGPFPTKAGEALGRKAQDYVIEQGRETGLEFLVAFDGDGQAIAHGHGSKEGLGLSPELEATLKDGARSVVVHHNHPSNTGFSSQDFVMLALPGMKTLWAHGHAGAVSRAELTPAARSVFGAGNPTRFRSLVRAVDRAVLMIGRDLINGGAVTVGRANEIHAHLVGQVLAEAGLIEYTSNIDAAAEIARPDVRPYLDQLVANTARSIHGTVHSPDRRSSEARRHPGDVGASFGTGHEAAGRRHEQAVDDRASEGNDRSDPDAAGFREESSPHEITPTSSAEDRQKAMQGFIARGQPLDRALRVPFDIFGGTDKFGRWKPGMYLNDKAANIIVNAEFDNDGRFRFLNPALETARTNLIDRYNLRNLPNYVARERARTLDERAIMLQGAEVLKSLKDQAIGPEEARVLQAVLTGEAVGANEISNLAEPIRQAIDQLGQEAVELGLLSAESFERNRGSYLHRVYLKHEVEQNGLVRMVNSVMGSRRKRILGTQFKGRGMFIDIGIPHLMRNVPGWHEGARGAPAKGEKFIRLDELAPQAEMEMDGEPPPQKALRTVFVPADQAVPDRYSSFQNQGTWEVRGKRGGKITIWRDYSKPEREKMGEILDARYTIGKTFMLMAHDLATGRFYRDIAQNEDWASKTKPAGEVIDAAEWQAGLRAYRPQAHDWVRVPETEIPKSAGKKRYGALAGMYVREEIWRDIHELEVMQRPHLWRTLLTQWKLNKTARNPVVHMNNVMANFMLMDMADVRSQDLVRGIMSYAKSDQHYQEAFENGAFGADVISQEIRKNVLQPILDDLAKTMTAQANANGMMGLVSTYTEKLWSGVKKFDEKMRWVYQLEDELFRMALYRRRREQGATPREAADMAREQFIDYDIRAPLIRAARNSVLPFISYTYRVIPMLAKTVATRPWKMAKYWTLFFGANALAYALLGDDGDEDKERKSLRDNEQGRSWVGTYNMTRWPANDRHGNPIFGDTRRYVPGGDLLDLSNGIVPPWLQFGGPAMIAAELILNRSAFTGRDIFNRKTDDLWRQTSKRAEYAYQALMPSAPWIPGSFYWDRIATAWRGGTDKEGRPYSVPMAVSSSLGIKLKPHDVSDAMTRKTKDFNAVKRELQVEQKMLWERQRRKLISESEFKSELDDLLRRRSKLFKDRQEFLAR